MLKATGELSDVVTQTRLLPHSTFDTCVSSCLLSDAIYEYESMGGTTSTVIFMCSETVTSTVPLLIAAAPLAAAEVAAAAWAAQERAIAAKLVVVAEVCARP